MKYEDWLAHFNPNHDKLGRFAKSHFGFSKKVDKTGDAKYNKDKGEKNDNKQVDWKKAAKTGAIITGVALAAIGTAYLVKSGKLGKLVNAGRNSLDSVLEKSGNNVVGEVLNNTDAIVGGSTSRIVGRRPSQIDTQMVASINLAGMSQAKERKINCTHCTTAYILNSLFGKNVTAKPFSGIDEMSGMRSDGRNVNIYRSLFDNIEYTNFRDKELPPKNWLGYEKPVKYAPWNEALGKIKSGTGVLHVIENKTGHGHVINYEKTKDGIITIIDPQHNLVFEATAEMLERAWRPVHAIDFSNATIKEDAKKIFDLMIK